MKQFASIEEGLIHPVAKEYNVTGATIRYYAKKS